MKAIETVYKGFKFRSRLEARWAVLFDGLGIEWRYEDEGFILEDGTWYLPDFYLPTFNGGMFVEVKPQFVIEEKEICRDLCFESKKSVLLAEGTPDFIGYIYLVRHDDDEGVTYYVGMPNADQASDENRMFCEPDYLNVFTRKIDEDYYPCLGEKYMNAILTARQARFEHKK
jgi:hypothetical protein